jgi:hypothetical protein
MSNLRHTYTAKTAKELGETSRKNLRERERQREREGE